MISTIYLTLSIVSICLQWVSLCYMLWTDKTRRLNNDTLHILLYTYSMWGTFLTLSFNALSENPEYNNVGLLMLLVLGLLCLSSLIHYVLFLIRKRKLSKIKEEVTEVADMIMFLFSNISEQRRSIIVYVQSMNLPNKLENEILSYIFNYMNKKQEVNHES